MIFVLRMMYKVSITEPGIMPKNIDSVHLRCPQAISFVDVDSQTVEKAKNGTLTSQEYFKSTQFTYDP